MDESRRTPYGAILIPGPMPSLVKPYPIEYLGKVIQWSSNPGWNSVFATDANTTAKCFYTIPDEALQTALEFIGRSNTPEPVKTTTAADLVTLRKGEFTIDDILRLKEKGLL